MILTVPIVPILSLPIRIVLFRWNMVSLSSRCDTQLSAKMGAWCSSAVVSFKKNVSSNVHVLLSLRRVLVCVQLQNDATLYLSQRLLESVNFNRFFRSRSIMGQYEIFFNVWDLCFFSWDGHKIRGKNFCPPSNQSHAVPCIHWRTQQYEWWLFCTDCTLKLNKLLFLYELEIFFREKTAQ